MYEGISLRVPAKESALTVVRLILKRWRTLRLRSMRPAMP